MQQITHNGQVYKYITPNEFLKNPSKYVNPNINTIKGTTYINLGSGFDIETTRIDEHHSTMYMWQYGLDDITIIGRTWYEFLDTLDALQYHLKLSADRKLLTFIHNASFEWQFLHKHVTLAYDNKHDKSKVFATEERKIIYFETIQNIEFRDSLILTQRPLEKLSSGYNLQTKKLVGDIDYSLKMTSATPITPSHIAYGINDSQLLVEFFHKYVKREFLSKQIKLPLTSTGIVRDELKRHFKSLDKRTREKHRQMLERAYPDEQEYKSIFKWLFRGGYVHSNGARSDEEITNELLGSQDFKSSYPAVLLHSNMPYDFCKKPPQYFDMIKYDRKFIEKNAFYGTFEFTNIRAKYPHSIESISKLIQYDKQSLISDNGRLVCCDKIMVCLTEYDWLIYNDFYEFDTVKCISKLRVSTKRPLPNWFKDLILKYFYLKETLDKESLEYKLAKSKLNSLYGMCVTSIINKSYTYIDKKLKLTTDNTSYEKLIKKEILLPYWGIWCTAIARYNLLHYGFYQFCKTDSYMDVLYGDTDSLKYKNIIGNDYIFKNYNDRMKRINKTMYVGNYDRNIFERLGTFDFEGKQYKAKFLGAKRYIYTTVDCNKSTSKYSLQHHVTVAGCRKGSLEKYCKENNKDIYQTFTNKLKLDETQSGKKTTFYNDEPFSMYITDVNGQQQYVEELSSVTLNDIPFTMTMTPEYIATILLLKKQNAKRIGDRKW